LTNKQEKFCREYLIDLNGTQAAIRAGYSEKTANKEACQLMAKLHIQERILLLKEKAAKRNQVTFDDLIHDLDEMRKADLKDLYDEDGNLKEIKDLPDSVTRIIQELSIIEAGPLKSTTKYKLYSKLEAIEKLAKHLGFYERDNVQKSIILAKYIEPPKNG